jgi:hypothetical protein
MSILVMQMMIGPLSASEIAKYSFDIPMSPAALASTMRKTQEGAPDVSLYKVVYRSVRPISFHIVVHTLRYLSWPAKPVGKVR